MADAQIKFPLWSCVHADGGLEIGADEDGSPLLPLWASEADALQQAPAGTIVVPLMPGDFADLLRKMPGDSTLAIYAGGMRYRQAAKQALAVVQDFLTEPTFDPAAFVESYRGVYRAIDRNPPAEALPALRAIADRLRAEWVELNGGDRHELHEMAFGEPHD